MRKISYAGYRFPPEIIDQAIWLYLRFTSAFATSRIAGRARDSGLLRDSAPLGESFRTDDCGRTAQAPPEAARDLAS